MSKREGLFDDLVTIAAKFPWWLGVLLAAVSYGGFHYIAVGDVPASTTAKAIGDVVIAAGAKTATTIFQYIAPIAFLAGAVLSANQGEHHFVQCKHWRATKVPVTVVRELYGVMAAQGAASGFVVTAGEFTRDARDFASGRNVELINGAALAAMLREASAQIRSTPAAGVPWRGIGEGEARSDAPPRCPKCGQPMVNRIARQGANAGSAFWGCSGFPACRGVRPSA